LRHNTVLLAAGESGTQRSGLDVLVGLWERKRVCLGGKLFSKSSVLRKPKKPGYSVPEDYRQVSILKTLGKDIDAVMAQRLSYLA
jgi:hypothetical protein